MATEQEGEKILQYLEKHGSADSVHLAKEWNEPHQKIVGTVKSLLCLGNGSNYCVISLFRGNCYIFVMQYIYWNFISTLVSYCFNKLAQEIP